MFAAMAWHLIGMMVKMAQMSEHGMGEHAESAVDDGEPVDPATWRRGRWGCRSWPHC